MTSNSIVKKFSELFSSTIALDANRLQLQVGTKGYLTDGDTNHTVHAIISSVDYKAKEATFTILGDL